MSRPFLAPRAGIALAVAVACGSTCCVSPSVDLDEDTIRACLIGEERARSGEGSDQIDIESITPSNAVVWAALSRVDRCRLAERRPDCDPLVWLARQLHRNGQKLSRPLSVEFAKHLPDADRSTVLPVVLIEFGSLNAADLSAACPHTWRSYLDAWQLAEAAKGSDQSRRQLVERALSGDEWCTCMVWRSDEIWHEVIRAATRSSDEQVEMFCGGVSRALRLAAQYPLIGPDILWQPHANVGSPSTAALLHLGAVVPGLRPDRAFREAVLKHVEEHGIESTLEGCSDVGLWNGSELLLQPNVLESVENLDRDALLAAIQRRYDRTGDEDASVWLARLGVWTRALPEVVQRRCDLVETAMLQGAVDVLARLRALDGTRGDLLDVAQRICGVPDATWDEVLQWNRMPRTLSPDVRRRMYETAGEDPWSACAVRATFWQRAEDLEIVRQISRAALPIAHRLLVDDRVGRHEYVTRCMLDALAASDDAGSLSYRWWDHLFDAQRCSFHGAAGLKARLGALWNWQETAMDRWRRGEGVWSALGQRWVLAEPRQ